MVSGTPDFYRTIRQTFGGAKAKTGGVNVDASATTELASVNGKGMIYGGVIYVAEAATQKASVPLLFIDGVQITQTSFEAMRARNVRYENTQPLYLLQFDEINFQYCVGFSRGVTFEKSFKISYQENHGDTPSVAFEVIYAIL